MSLHDMYFSIKNKNHIFSVLQDLILKETGYNIIHNENYIDLYRVKYPLIFERNNIGVAVKDKSNAEILHTNFENNSIQLSAYSKNWQYRGGGKAFIYRS